MSKEKAKEFIKYLRDNQHVTEKMKGFTLDELKEAADDLKKDGTITDEDMAHYPY
jgi:hypothetical protein